MEDNGMVKISLRDWLQDTTGSIIAEVKELRGEMADIREAVHVVDKKVDILATTVKLKTGMIALAVGSIPSIAATIYWGIRLNGE